MTIFLQIAKHYLNLSLRATCKASIDADKGWATIARNKEVSVQKRAKMELLIGFLETMPDEDTDRSSYEWLRDKIKHYRDEATEIGKAKGYIKPGIIEKGVADALLMFEALYDKFLAMNFLNIADTMDDPFDVYRGCAAWYIADKLVKDRTPPTLYEWAVSDPNTGGGGVVTQEKEALLVKSLARCADSLQDVEGMKAEEVSEETFASYIKVRQNTVVAELRLLRDENRLLCERHGLPFQLPIFSFAFFSASVKLPSFIGPTIKTLDDTIAKAMLVLAPGKESEQQHHAAPSASMV